MKRLFYFFASLRLALFLLMSLAIALGIATFLESFSDTLSAQYWVYQSFWFFSLLFFLGLNILCVALSRYPWKFHHLPFLLAHAGILLVLGGSLITQKYGVDGSLRLEEGKKSQETETQNAFFHVQTETEQQEYPLPWQPEIIPFHPVWLSLKNKKEVIAIDQYLPYASAEVSFIKNPEQDDSDKKRPAFFPALKIHISGGAMAISSSYWLWGGSPETKNITAGPAHFSWEQDTKNFSVSGLSIHFDRPTKNTLRYQARLASGKKITGTLSTHPLSFPFSLPLHLPSGVQISLESYLPEAFPLVIYKPVSQEDRKKKKDVRSAIHVITASGADVWLGLGEQARFFISDQMIQFSYLVRSVILPFSLRLDHFFIEYDPGTQQPAAYSSLVTVKSVNETSSSDLFQKTISMNEPLELKGYSVYQSSYEPGDPRPTVSIFSVNYDPGRIWKYLGSWFIILGSLWLFLKKTSFLRKKKNENSVVPL